MTLPLAPLLPEVQKLAQKLAADRKLYRRAAQEARTILKQSASRNDELRPKARELRTAIPSWEPLDYIGNPPLSPRSFTAIAADGSQIQPDRHGIALYYVINVGSIVLHHGSGQTPQVRTTPSLYYAEEDLYEDQKLVQGNLLDVRRDIAEMKELADRIEETCKRNLTPSNRILALADGTLLLWVLEEARDKHIDKIQRYLHQMDRIKRAGTALAGFTSRPRYTEVVDLLRLASAGEETLRGDRSHRRWGRLTDAALFAFLRPGQRSALFESPSPINDSYGPHRIFYFYLHTGSEIARIEIPQWVAQDEELLNFTHSAILKQCEPTLGYPYVLVRAHELAVIKPSERANLEAMIERALISQGIIPRPSEKERWKRTI